MPRTVVYPSPATRTIASDAAADAVTPPKTETSQEDGFGDKLVKYIPAEVIAFYVSGYILAGQLGKAAQWTVLVACLLGTAAYLFVRADKVNPPRWYFYVLAIISFLAWAVGTSTAGADLLMWPTDKAEIMGKFIVTAAVFLVPLTDELLTKLLPNAPTLPAPQPANS